MSDNFPRCYGYKPLDLASQVKNDCKDCPWVLTCMYELDPVKTVEYKYIKGDTGKIQTILNQWRHNFDLVIETNDIRINGDIQMLVKRTEK